MFSPKEYGTGRKKYILVTQKINFLRSAKRMQNTQEWLAEETSRYQNESLTNLQTTVC